MDTDVENGRFKVNAQGDESLIQDSWDEELRKLMDRVRAQQWSVQAARAVVAWMLEEKDLTP